MAEYDTPAPAVALPKQNTAPIFAEGPSWDSNAALLDELQGDLPASELAAPALDNGIADVNAWAFGDLVADNTPTRKDVESGMSTAKGSLSAGRFVEAASSLTGLADRAREGLLDVSGPEAQGIQARVTTLERVSGRLGFIETSINAAKEAAKPPAKAKDGDLDGQPRRDRLAAQEFKKAADAGEDAEASVRYAIKQKLLSEVEGKAVLARLAPMVSRARQQRGLVTQVVHQHSTGGDNPGGYCAIASLRMLLGVEGLDDPGANAIASGSFSKRDGKTWVAGAYTGEGSDIVQLGEQATAQGLSGVSATRQGNTSDVLAALDGGTPVVAGGKGQFTGTYVEDTKNRKPGEVKDVKRGETYSHVYPELGHYMVVSHYDSRPLNKGEIPKEGQLVHNGQLVTRFQVCDPDTGTRMYVTPADFETFFQKDGDKYLMTYKGANPDVLEAEREKKEGKKPAPQPAPSPVRRGVGA